MDIFSFSIAISSILILVLSCLSFGAVVQSHRVLFNVLLMRNWFLTLFLFRLLAWICFYLYQFSFFRLDLCSSFWMSLFFGNIGYVQIMTYCIIQDFLSLAERNRNYLNIEGNFGNSVCNKIISFIILYL
jgi:hypothetical protein